MAQKLAAPNRAPSPPRALMGRLTETMSCGATPDRMVRAMGDAVVRLRQEGDAEEVQVWLDELRDGFVESTEAAIEAIDEIESAEKAQRRHAENASRAMVACRDALSRALSTPVFA